MRSAASRATVAAASRCGSSSAPRPCRSARPTTTCSGRCSAVVEKEVEMKMTRPTCNGLLSRRQAVALLAAFGVAEETLAQNATTANPRSYRVVLENERVRVIEYKSRPGLGVCGEGLHSHP